jgi:hypothetical protein
VRNRAYTVNLRKRVTEPRGENAIAKTEWMWVCTCRRHGQWTASKTAAQTHGSRHLKGHQTSPKLGL